MKALVILTLEYPDSILENELPYLAKAFDRVYVLPQVLKGEEDFQNVRVTGIFRPLLKKDFFKLLLRYFFKLAGIFLYTLQSPDRRKYFSSYRSFIGHFLNEAQKIDALEKFVRDNKLSNAIFYDYWLVDATLSLAILKSRGVIRKTISRVHGFDLYDERQYEGCVAFRDYRVEHLDAVFAISEHGYQYMRSKLLPHLRSKVKLSYLGVKDPEFQLAKNRFKENQFVIVSCARIIPLKRVTLLLDVLSRSKLNIHWVHFGGGQMEAELKQAAETLPPNISVDLMGETNNRSILDFYSTYHIDLFVSLSISEGIPVSMMEAISYGIPVLACRLNGIPEIVNEVTGRLIPIDANAETILSELEAVLKTEPFDRQAIYHYFRTRFNARSNYQQFISEIHQLYKMAYHPPAYQECVNCVLNTNDDAYLTFNDDGICRYCVQYNIDIERLHREGKPGAVAFDSIVQEIKAAGAGKTYDCIIGISGGVDSTYLAWLAKSKGLRPLAVHFDNGWNSELAVMNIEKIVTKLGLDLYTLVVDWNEFRDLQLAFLKASVIDIELVTDQAMLATLYKLALKKRIKYILSGHNHVSEAILPKTWYHDKRDHIHLRAIHDQFGSIAIKKFPHLNSWLKFQVELRQIQTVQLLDYVRYNVDEAKQFLISELGWRDYGGKHFESVFTRFYQGYILPRKFGVDKRKAHLSNLICSGQLTRVEAKAKLSAPPYSPELQLQDRDFVVKKLELSDEEFSRIMALPVKRHSEYRIETSLYERFQLLKALVPFWRTFKSFRKTI